MQKRHLPPPQNPHSQTPNQPSSQPLPPKPNIRTNCTDLSPPRRPHPLPRHSDQSTIPPNPQIIPQLHGPPQERPRSSPPNQLQHLRHIPTPQPNSLVINHPEQRGPHQLHPTQRPHNLPLIRHILNPHHHNSLSPNQPGQLTPSTTIPSIPNTSERSNIPRIPNSKPPLPRQSPPNRIVQHGSINNGHTDNPKFSRRVAPSYSVRKTPRSCNNGTTRSANSSNPPGVK